MLWRSHGFRSSFRNWAAEESDHPREVIEAALAHVAQNKVEAAHARSDLFERQRLMDKWATYVASESSRSAACREYIADEANGRREETGW